jgi:hypothetical protein
MSNKIEANYKNLERVISWIESADIKASIILGFNGGLITILLQYIPNILNAIRCYSTYKSLSLIIILAVFLIFFTLSIYNAFRVIFPDITPRKSKNKLFYFLTITGYPKEAFIKQMNTITDEKILKTLADQTYINATIASNKFKHARKGWGYLIGSLVSGLILIFSYLFILKF